MQIQLEYMWLLFTQAKEQRFKLAKTQIEMKNSFENQICIPY